MDHLHGFRNVVVLLRVGAVRGEKGVVDVFDEQHAVEFKRMSHQLLHIVPQLKLLLQGLGVT